MILRYPRTWRATGPGAWEVILFLRPIAVRLSGPGAWEVIRRGGDETAPCEGTHLVY